MAKVLHKSKMFQRGEHTFVTTTLCGRVHRGDEMNVADNDDMVTCKFCLRTINRIKNAKVIYQH